MIFMVLLAQTVLSALGEEPPAPPQDVHLQNWLLTWTPPPEETAELTYTVQSSFHDDAWKGIDTWKDIPTCAHRSFTSCNVTLTAAESRHGCAMLRVVAERRGLTSKPALACSLRADSCTPEVSLSARPGSLTVHLSRDHRLVESHADHAGHRVYVGIEGEEVEELDSTSSLTLRQLQEGQRYCAQVGFILYNKSLGPPTCPKCELIPNKDAEMNPGVIVGAVLVLFVLIMVTMYVLIYHSGKIKRWLRLPYTIPDDFRMLQPLPIPTCSPTEEHFEEITCVTPVEGEVTS
ncbi:interferon gamma receptor 2 isoform X2 [Xyrichtys novacula]|nr:interferon gamma receptor 2 isoform X2 [Xyrichtys novacula]